MRMDFCQKSKWNLCNMRVSYQVTRISDWILLYLFNGYSRWTHKIQHQHSFEQAPIWVVYLCVFFFKSIKLVWIDTAYHDCGRMVARNQFTTLTLLWNFRSASTYCDLLVQIRWASMAWASGQGILQMFRILSIFNQTIWASLTKHRKNQSNQNASRQTMRKNP